MRSRGRVYGSPTAISRSCREQIGSYGPACRGSRPDVVVSMLTKEIAEERALGSLPSAVSAQGQRAKSKDQPLAILLAKLYIT